MVTSRPEVIPASFLLHKPTMDNKIQELKFEITELESLLGYVLKSRYIVSDRLYSYLIAKIRSLHQQLLELQYNENLELRKLTNSN